MAQGDQVNAGARWIPPHEYDLILSRVPILCVDLILLSGDEPAKVGLIKRDTYAGGNGWCLIGGAVIRDEPLPAAVVRHLRATLGYGMDADLNSLKLFGVVQYFTDPRTGRFHDPRKHAVSLTYVGRCIGKAQVRKSGEARDFAWFSREELDELTYGFRQGEIIASYLRKEGDEENCQVW
jgi:ADP-ribose pyrophosphatase YjhB (NUDIX family)